MDWTALNRRFATGTAGREMVVFLLVGGCIAVWYAAWIAALHHGLGWRYPIALSVSYAVAVSTHFLVNRSITFKAKTGSMRKTSRQLRRYLVFLAVHYGFTLCVVTFFVEVMLWPVMVASAIAIVLATGFGFIASKHWVFAKD